MQEGKVPYGDFIATAPMLRGQRDVGDECARGVRIKTRDDQYRTGLGSQHEIRQSDTIRLAFIERIEHFLYDGPGRLQIQNVGVGQLHRVSQDLLHLGRHLRPGK